MAARSTRTTPDERLAVFVRMARRLRRAKRDSPTMEDYRVVAREAGCSAGTLRSWWSRYPEEWDRAREAEGIAVATEHATAGSSGHVDAGDVKSPDPDLLQRAAERPPVATDPTDVAPIFEVVAEHEDPRVTPQQMRAIVLDLHAWGTRQQIAGELGVTPQTLSRWFHHDPAVKAVRRELELELVAQIRRHHLAVTAEAAEASLILAREVKRAARGVLNPETGEVKRWDPENLGRLARAATALGADAADRAGFPKSSISQHMVGGVDPHSDLDEMSLEEWEAEARRLEAVEASWREVGGDGAALEQDGDEDAA